MGQVVALARPTRVDVVGLDNLSGELRICFAESRDTSIRAVARAVNVSHTWLRKFVSGQDVCMWILNRLANYWGVSYIVTNASNDHVDFFGIDALASELRSRLRDIEDDDSLLNISQHVESSRTWLQQFRDGQNICMRRMAELADYFEITYVVTNYEDRSKEALG